MNTKIFSSGTLKEQPIIDICTKDIFEFKYSFVTKLGDKSVNNIHQLSVKTYDTNNFLTGMKRLSFETKEEAMLWIYNNSAVAMHDKLIFAEENGLKV